MRSPRRPAWELGRDTFLETARSVGDVVAVITDLDAPGLGEWTIGELAAHAMRAVTAPARYLEEPPAQQITMPDAAAYFVAYLDRRDADADLDSRVAERGKADAAGTDPRSAWAGAVARVGVVLATADPDRVVSTPFGGIRLSDYLPTRTFELTVHGLDLAAAAGADWKPPAAALTSTTMLLVAIALRRGSAADAIGLLTGRDWANGPVLR